LEVSVQQGSRTVDFYRWVEKRPSTLRSFQAMLERMAEGQSAEVLDLVPIPNTAATLLDIGGGHAGYSIAFCRRYPGLRATIVDLPGALALGRVNVQRAGLHNRIDLRAGNWRFSKFDDHDVVLMFNILHGNGVAENGALVRAAAEAYTPVARW
jgi:O-methyltransferase domain